jgi:hypothetical protein
MTRDDWQCAVDAVKWPLEMNTMPMVDLSLDMYEGDAVALVQSVRDRLDTFEQGTYNWQYAYDRLNRLFQTYL